MKFHLINPIVGSLRLIRCPTFRTEYQISQRTHANKIMSFILFINYREMLSIYTKNNFSISLAWPTRAGGGAAMLWVNGEWWIVHYGAHWPDWWHPVSKPTMPPVADLGKINKKAFESAAVLGKRILNNFWIRYRSRKIWNNKQIDKMRNWKKFKQQTN